MPRRKPDIIFTEPVQHHTTPRQANYNTARRRNVKRSFGIFAMLIGITALLMFFFPLIDLPLGILGLILGYVALQIKTDGRDVGHHMAMVGVMSSAVSLVLAGAFWFMDSKNKKEEKLDQEQKQVALVDSVTGVWKSNKDDMVTLEFTPGGNLIFSKLASSNEDAEPLTEQAGLYQVTSNNMTIAFGPDSTTFTYEILPSSELRIMAPSDRDIRFNLDGKWRKIKTTSLGVDFASTSPEIKKYFEQLDKYTERKKVLIKNLVKYTNEKDTILSDLNEYQIKDKNRDDQWRMLGRELKSVTEYITNIEDRISSIDTVIVRLQAIIRNEGRQQDISKLNMTEDELVELLKTSMQLEDQLAAEDEIEVLSDDEVEKMLIDATRKKKEEANSSQ